MRKNDDIPDEEKNIEGETEETTEVGTLKIRVEELEDQVRRVLADYQNLQKRVQEEKGEWIKSANKNVFLHLLPVLDTLMLANKHMEHQGLGVSIKMFQAALKDEGVEVIETKGKHFDPSLMECITVQKGEDGEVLEEVRTGYMLYGKLLRPAQVVVGDPNAEEKEKH